MPGSIHINLNKLSMRRTRFRKKAGAIAWDNAGGSSNAFEAYIDAVLPQACKAANSIETFRDLHPHEIAEMELQNLSRYPGRAHGAKDASDVKLQQKRSAALAQYNMLKAKFDKENRNGTSNGNTDNNSEEVVEHRSDQGVNAGGEGDSVSLEDSARQEVNGSGYKSPSNLIMAHSIGEHRYRSLGESHEDDNFADDNGSETARTEVNEMMMLVQKRAKNQTMPVKNRAATMENLHRRSLSKVATPREEISSMKIPQPKPNRN